MVPTPGRILPINRYFPEIPGLTRKKAASLAGRENAQKTGRSAVFLEPGGLPGTAMSEKSQGKVFGEK
jgi:hypothetical protein